MAYNNSSQPILSVYDIPIDVDPPPTSIPSTTSPFPSAAPLPPAPAPPSPFHPRNFNYNFTNFNNTDFSPASYSYLSPSSAPSQNPTLATSPQTPNIAPIGSAHPNFAPFGSANPDFASFGSANTNFTAFGSPSPNFSDSPTAYSPSPVNFDTPPYQAPINNTFHNSNNYNFDNHTNRNNTNQNVNNNNNNNNNNSNINNNNNFEEAANADKPAVLPRLSWNVIIRVLEAKNLHITKKKYNPRCIVKLEDLLNGKTKECKTDLSHPVWNHNFERVSISNPYAIIEFEVEACGTIFSEKIGTCKLDLNTIAYGKTERNWLPINAPGSEKLSAAQAAEAIRGELLVEIERSIPIRENFIFTFKWADNKESCTIYNHFDTPVFTVTQNYVMLNTSTNAIVFSAVAKSRSLQPKSHTYEFAIVQNGTELSDLETSMNKTIKYHVGGPETGAHWQNITTMECRKYTMDFGIKVRYSTSVINNDTQQSDATYQPTKSRVEIKPAADVLQLLFLIALSEIVPFPEKPVRAPGGSGFPF